MKQTRLLAAATIIVAILWACEKENNPTPLSCRDISIQFSETAAAGETV